MSGRLFDTAYMAWEAGQSPGRHTDTIIKHVVGVHAHHCICMYKKQISRTRAPPEAREHQEKVKNAFWFFLVLFGAFSSFPK